MQVIAEGMSVLRQMYPGAPDPVQSAFTRWAAEPFSRGAYRCPLCCAVLGSAVLRAAADKDGLHAELLRAEGRSTAAGAMHPLLPVVIVTCTPALPPPLHPQLLCCGQPQDHHPHPG